MKYKSVALIINSSEKGGAGKILKYVANLYSEHGLKVNFISIFKENVSQDLNSNINFLSLDIESTGFLIWRMKAIMKLRSIIRKEKCDFVMSFMSDVSFLSRISTLGLNVKFVVSERNDPYSRPVVWKLLTLLTYGFSDLCVFQLAMARDYFPSFIRNKSLIICNPIDKKLFLRNEIDRKKTIVGAGRFVKEKGFDILIKAFCKVHISFPDYKLVLYGEGPLLDFYQSLVVNLDLCDYVLFPGYIKSIRESVCNDGIFVLSSRSEGIPNVLIEALSVGIPVVSTDCTPGGARYLTEDGKYGILVPVDNVEAMADAVIRILRDDNLRKWLEKEGPKSLMKIDNLEIDKAWLNILYF